MSRLLIAAGFKATISSRVGLDAILFEVMFVNERNDRHGCISRLKSAVRKFDFFFRGPTNILD